MSIGEFVSDFRSRERQGYGTSIDGEQWLFPAHAAWRARHNMTDGPMTKCQQESFDVALRVACARVVAQIDKYMADFARS